jgi:hypothetical protein
MGTSAAREGTSGMKYLQLIYGNQETWDAIPPDAVNAKQVCRVDGGPAVTDGPHADGQLIELWPVGLDSAADL